VKDRLRTRKLPELGAATLRRAGFVEDFARTDSDLIAADDRAFGVFGRNRTGFVHCQTRGTHGGGFAMPMGFVHIWRCSAKSQTQS
jgi:hypothetical protein